jgi:heme exporter protein A
MSAKLEAHGLGCVRGERRLFSGVSFALARGQTLRVAGANGSGKTSLLRILCGLLTPTEGEVRWDARAIGALREDYHRELLYIGHLNGLKEELTPMENLQVAAVLAGVPAGLAERAAALEELGLKAQADLQVRYLSQGQRRRVALARLMLCARAPLWILDEPFTALDARAVQTVGRLVAEHAASGGMVVFTTHQEVPIPGVRELVIDLDRQGAHA